MKNIVTLIAASLIFAASPAYAGGDRRDDRWGVDTNRYGSQSRYARRDSENNNDWVAPLLGGIIIGAILNDGRNRPKDPSQVETPSYRDQYQYRPYAPTTVCRNEYVHNRYGDLVTDQYGNLIVRRRVCWTQ